jgi:hypothetical protein
VCGVHYAMMPPSSPPPLFLTTNTYTRTYTRMQQITRSR